MSGENFVWAKADGTIEPYGAVTLQEASWWDKLKHKLTFGWLGSRYIARGTTISHDDLKSDPKQPIGIALEDSKEGTVEIEIDSF